MLTIPSHTPVLNVFGNHFQECSLPQFLRDWGEADQPVVSQILSKAEVTSATFHFSGTSPSCHNLTETTESSLTLANSFNTRFKHCLCYFPMSRILYGLLSYFCGLWCSKSNRGISPFLHKTMNKWVFWNGISPSVIPPCKISLWIQWMKTSWVSMTISHGAQAFKKT